jgi:hypothetical protein
MLWVDTRMVAASISCGLSAATQLTASEGRTAMTDIRHEGTGVPARFREHKSSIALKTVSLRM